MAHLKQSVRKGGRVYLSIVESYHKDGISKTRTIKSLGYLDELERHHDDPVAKFTAEARGLTEARKKENAPVHMSFTQKEKISMRSANTVNTGHAVLSYYYHRLEIDRFWANRRMRGGFKFDPNAIFKLLVYMRVISPSSKAKAYALKGRLIDRTDFTDDDMYRALGFFAGYEADLVKWVYDRLAKGGLTDSEYVYYDVTNYYFEIEEEDALRKRGVSKEHRKSPIVQMGLLVDKAGIPIDYRLFEGNTLDSQTLMPVLSDLKARHKAGHICVVADKGLNTGDNMAANILAGNGFVFSQSVRLATKELKGWIKSPDGYKGDDGFRIKSRIRPKAIRVTGPDGQKQKVDVDVLEVAFWSRDFAVRQASERAKVIEKSLSAVRRGGLSSAKSKTALRYVTDTAVVLRTGELADHVLGLDTAKIAQEAEMDGYYCIVTNELDKGPREVIDAYRGLWRIEDAFKVTKPVLEARPVYVSRHDHIRAHFMTCYTALLLLRLIQADLGWQYPASAIAKDLSEANGVRMKDNHFLFSHRTELTDRLAKLCGIDLSRLVLSAKDLKDLIAKTKKR